MTRNQKDTRISERDLTCISRILRVVAQNCLVCEEMCEEIRKQPFDFRCNPPSEHVPRSLPRVFTILVIVSFMLKMSIEL